jgi:hypothetical protein
MGTAILAGVARMARIATACCCPFIVVVDVIRGRLEVETVDRFATGGRRVRRVAALSGEPAQDAMLPVFSWVKRHGFFRRAHDRDLQDRGRTRFHVNEALGARIALLLWGLGRVQKHVRQAQISVGIATMGDEEAVYWYGKALRNRGLVIRALRLMLAGE